MFRQLRKTVVTLCCLFSIWGTLAWNAECSAATIIGPQVALSTLLDAGTVTAGDKVFTNFGYTFTNDMPGAIGVSVVPIRDDLGNYGIRFVGSFHDLGSSAGGSAAVITYKLTAGPERLISDAHLAGDPDLTGTTGFIKVTETFLPLGQFDQFTMRIYDDEGQVPAKLMDSTIFTTPIQSLDVQKGISASVPAGGGSATMMFVDQTFSQVPEPVAGLLMLCGIASLGFVRKRRLLER